MQLPADPSPPTGTPPSGDAAYLPPDATPDFGALEGMARMLTASGVYKVLRRFAPRGRYGEPTDPATVSTALFVDVEATGLDTRHDAIIEFAAVPFTYCRESSQILAVLEPYVAYEDPGREIPPEVQELTGISPADVAGHRIDDGRVEALLRDAALVIAHNAGYDRPMLERRFPGFARKKWACSLGDVPWATRFGVRGSKLDYLLLQRCGEFFDGHRAEHDCQAAIHVLATCCDKGNPFALLREAAARPTLRVRALGSPFESKDLLKARGYRWNGEARVWWRDCTPDTLDAELSWLCAECYENRLAPDDFTRAKVGERGADRAYVLEFGAGARYSARVS